MLGARDLLRRIRSIGNTAKITNTMQMVAASKMRKAQQAALAGRPFVRLLYRIQRKATTQAVDFAHPLLEKREVGKRAVIIIGTDKGLCGSLNGNLFRQAAAFDKATTTYVAVGKKAGQFIARSGRNLAAEFTFSDAPRFHEAKRVATFARDLFLTSEVDEVRVVASHFVNTLRQTAVTLDFLPVGAIGGIRLEGAENEAELAAHANDYRFEPSPEDVLGYLLAQYLDIFIFQVMLNAKASEQSARMVSMKSATESAEGLIKDLTLEYNKLRQGAITTELLDIAGGQESTGE
ncbi:MAG TPA: ATP synthase F1 subunit gamma [Planctomycetia bacterium]|nr:ATP synthase F1 subunit gamma [Planctomycetia bacterium]